MASLANDAAVKRSRRREQQHKDAEEQATTYNSMLCVDHTGAPTSRVKWYCPECGLPRDPALAEVAPCGACGALGTQKKAPQFDEDGEKVPDAIIEQRNAERVQRLQEARQRKRTAQQAIVEDYPASDAAKAIKLVQAAQAKPQPTPLADLFLAAL